MRLRLLAAASTVALTSGAVAFAAAPPVPVPLVVPALPGSTLSKNVTHVGTIPLDGVGVSLRTAKVGKQVRAIVSGAGGLSIFDATDPTKPLLLGHLPMYNWENEDIAVSEDGKTAIMSEFQGSLYLHVVDISDPSLPRITATMAPGGAHTVECADRACSYLYGSEGQTYDIRDRTKVVELPAAQSWGQQVGLRSGHNVTRDASGTFLADAGSDGIIVFKAVGSPVNVQVLSRGTVTKNTAYQHNSVRPRAAQWKPRSTTTGPLRAGELLIGEGETNFKPQCSSGSGAFSTWSMAGFDKGVPLKQLSVLRPVSGQVGAADPAVTALGCSGHWFTTSEGKDGSILVAAAWYEHGTRLLSVNPATGAIKQVGFFQPQRGSASAAYWMGGDVIWTVDYHSGIDILRFDQNPALRPTTAAIDASWLSRLGVDPFSEAIRKMCRLGAAATTKDHADMHALQP